MTNDESAVFKGRYQRYIRNKYLFIGICIVATVVALGVSLDTGATKMGFTNVLEYVWNHICGVSYEHYSDEWFDDYLIWNHRLPRALFAIVAGAALAVAGACMQSVMNNPLADPYTTGISSGAQFGIAVSIILGFNVVVSATVSNIGTTVNAFVFSLLPTILILSVSARGRTSPATLILVGTAVSFMFNSFNMLLMLTTDEGSMSEVYTSLVGSLGNISWNDFTYTFVIVLIGSIAVMFLSNKLNIMSLQDNTAKSLGVDADRIRLIGLVTISVIVAAVTCFAGIIGFVGLVSPHIVRSIVDADNKYLIPASAIFSGLFLLVADVISRTIAPNGSIPVGIVMAFIGAPIFLYLIVRRNSNVW